MRDFTGIFWIALILTLSLSPDFVGKMYARAEAGYYQERDRIYGKPQVQP